MVASGENEVVTIVRDFTEQRRAQAKIRQLAAEQAALRRVATLVAGMRRRTRCSRPSPEEVCRLLDLRSALMLRYLEPGAATIVGKFGDPPDDFLVGSRLELTEGAAVRVLRTGAPVRVDYGAIESDLAARMRGLGLLREHRRPDQRRRRHLGCPDRGHARARGAARRDRAPAPGVRRAGGPGPLERAGARGAGRLAAAGSSRRATRRGGGSSATSTTAPSSAWSRSRWACGSPRRRCAAIRSWRRSISPRRRLSSPRRSRSCGSWRRASIRRC